MKKELCGVMVPFPVWQFFREREGIVLPPKKVRKFDRVKVLVYSKNSFETIFFNGAFTAVLYGYKGRDATGDPVSLIKFAFDGKNWRAQDD